MRWFSCFKKQKIDQYYDIPTNIPVVTHHHIDKFIHREIVDEILHIVAVISNVCEFESRWRLAKDFFKRVETTPNVKLYIVELAYGEQEYNVTDPLNPNHLQLRTKDILWHKESMINVGVNNLLPKDWKYFAFVDADIEYCNLVNQTPDNWARDAIKTMSVYNVIQLFTLSLDTDEDKSLMNIFQGGAYLYRNSLLRKQGVNYPHPGYAWAMTRKFYDESGGLLDDRILGSGDYHMYLCWTNSDFENIRRVLSKTVHKSYIDSIERYHERCILAKVNIGYIKYIIKHHFHGKKIDRGYNTREKILVDYKYNPYTFIKRNEVGLIEYSEIFPEECKKKILDYFWSRKE